MPQSGSTDKLFYSAEIAAIIRRPWCTTRNKNRVGFLLTRNCSSLDPWLVQDWDTGWCWPKMYTQTQTTNFSMSVPTHHSSSYLSGWLVFHSCIQFWVNLSLMQSALLDLRHQISLKRSLSDREARGFLLCLKLMASSPSLPSYSAQVHQSQTSREAASLRNKFFFALSWYLAGRAFLLFRSLKSILFCKRIKKENSRKHFPGSVQVGLMSLSTHFLLVSGRQSMWSWVLLGFNIPISKVSERCKTPSCEQQALQKSGGGAHHSEALTECFKTKYTP